MAKNLLKTIICFILILSLSACSPVETVSGWIDSFMSLFPNDIEATIGNNIKDEDHVMILSTGYVNTLKNESYHIVYHLDDGREVSLATNGTRYASTYQSRVPSFEGEEVPSEHIVLSKDIYYWVDDNAKTLYKVNPANYEAFPIEIETSGISFSSSGDTTWNGMNVTYETYSTDSGKITFYYSSKIICGMLIEQDKTYELKNVTSIDKYYSSSFIALPSAYTVVDAWK